MTGNSPSDKKVQIFGIGVNAFSALCTVLAALITAGLFCRPRYCNRQQACAHGHGHLGQISALQRTARQHRKRHRPVH